MRTLVLGAEGQLGRALCREFASHGLAALSSSGCDVTDSESLREAFRRHRPGLVLCAAAFTRVDEAESNPEEAFRVNARAPEEIASLCLEFGSKLIHFSTDYVFSGAGSEPHTEESPAEPLSVYGKSKLAGDLAVLSSGVPGFVLRTSWVFSEEKGFPSAIIRKALVSPPFQVTDAEIGTPVTADFLASLCRRLVPLVPDGRCELLNAVPDGFVSRFGLAQFALSEAAPFLPLRTRAEDLIPVRALTPPLPARRPENSRLSNGKLKSLPGIRPGSWQDAARPVIRKTVLALSKARTPG